MALRALDGLVVNWPYEYTQVASSQQLKKSSRTYPLWCVSLWDLAGHFAAAVLAADIGRG